VADKDDLGGEAEMRKRPRCPPLSRLDAKPRRPRSGRRLGADRAGHLLRLLVDLEVVHARDLDHGLEPEQVLDVDLGVVGRLLADLEAAHARDLDHGLEPEQVLDVDLGVVEKRRSRCLTSLISSAKCPIARLADLLFCDKVAITGAARTECRSGEHPAAIRALRRAGARKYNGP
jgi:hypothetical protein